MRTKKPTFKQLVNEADGTGADLKWHIRDIENKGMPSPDVENGNEAWWLSDPRTKKDGFFCVYFDARGHFRYKISFKSNRYSSILDGYKIIWYDDQELGDLPDSGVLPKLVKAWKLLVGAGSGGAGTDNRHWRKRKKQEFSSVFVFSRFDSRGGSFLRIGGSEETAKADYLAMFGEDSTSEIVDDYLGHFTMVVCDKPARTGHGDDLLYDQNFASGFDGKTLVLWSPIDSGHEESNIPDGVQYDNLGEDAVGLVVF